MTAPTQGPSPDTTVSGPGEEEIEKEAQRLFEADPSRPLLSWGGLWASRRERYRNDARTALFDTQPPSRSSGGVERDIQGAYQEWRTRLGGDPNGRMESAFTVAFRAGWTAASRLTTLPHSDREDEGRDPVKGSGCVAEPEPASGALGPEGTHPSRIVRHKKTGGLYEVLGEAEGQVSTGNYRVWPAGADPHDGDGLHARLISDGVTLMIYRNPSTGKLWFRASDEFEDGRFEDASLPASPEEADHA